MTAGDGEQAHAVIDAYNAHAVRWAERLRATEMAPPPGGAPPDGERPADGDRTTDEDAR